MSKSKTLLIFFVLTGMLILPLASALSHKRPPMENNIKAAYIFNFAKLVDWPESAFDSPGSPLCLGILGDDPFTATLMTIDNKIARSKRILIKRYATIAEIGQCHILFIGISCEKNLDKILTKLQNKPCLTVSNIEGFADRGGMINFILINNRIRFEINLQTTRKSALKVSSRLLKIAKIVGGLPEREKE